jgi:polyhydroxybutyrate depolymerase
MRIPVAVLLATLVTALLATGCAGSPEPRRSAAGEHTLTVDGRERGYLLHVPPGAEGPLPVLLVLHGGGGNARQVSAQTRLSELADETGFIAVYPNGTGRTSLLTWNAGACCGYAERQRVDDVAFVAALLDEVLADQPADPERVFVTGMSNGAMMSYRLACELSDRITGIAPVAGARNVTPCRPSRPVSVLAVHGTADELVPYAGGPPARPAPGNETWVNASVADSVGFWVDQDGCRPQPTERTDGDVTTATYAGCAQGSEVVLHTVAGGGHAWPGGGRSRAEADPVPPEPDASRLIAEFVTRAR